MSTVRRFRAMGCKVVVAGADPVELAAVRALFAERERRFSRFSERSELHRVNGCSGHPVVVSEEFAAMVGLALWASAATGGLVDPTLGAAIASAGYDRDFAVLRRRGPGPARPGPGLGCRGGIALQGRLLTLPAGVALDLNGVVKSATVDDALALLGGDGWISAGGDLAARGGVGVALPGEGQVQLAAGAIATSGRMRRSWVQGGARQHHLIDPATGRPSCSRWEQVTVSGATCLDADVAAKAAFLIGDAGPAWLDERGMPGRFLARGNRVTLNEAWRAAVRDREPACT